MILDTSAISAYADGNLAVLQHLRTSRVHSVPTVVLGEYRFGLMVSNLRTERQQWLDRFEHEMEILDVTSSTARLYAKVRRGLREIGRPIPENDIWIAALAREHGLAILSRDTHFDFVSEVVRVGW